MSTSPKVALSSLDTERWGVVTARANDVRRDDVGALEAFCRESAVGLLIARCSTEELPAAQAMERAGYSLMDTLVYYGRDVSSAPPVEPSDGEPVVRSVKPGEEEAVRDLARVAFRNYAGHYHADPRLEQGACDEVYADWAYRSCVDPSVADDVLVGALAGEIVAFATVRFNSELEGEGVLFGVGPSARGRGLYRRLVVHAMDLCASRGRSQMVVSTQVTNVHVQKVWARLGFVPTRSCHTFHKWFAGA
jgi:GNAT superfamily N-acetyltransferase